MKFIQKKQITKFRNIKRDEQIILLNKITKPTHLILENKFNQEINLPHTLTHLIIGDNFNQEINLPQTLTHLIMGFYFNKEIKGKTELQIFNTAGDRVLQKVFFNINNTVSVEYNLPAGTYMVVVHTEKGMEHGKLVVIK